MEKKQYKRGQHPNSKKSLKPIQKGEVRNPEGGRALNTPLQVFARFTHDTFREVLEVVMKSDEIELAIIAETGPTSLHRLVAGAFQQAIETKNFGLVERIADRIIGRPTETVNANLSGALSANLSASQKEIFEMVDKARKNVGK